MMSQNRDDYTAYVYDLTGISQNGSEPERSAPKWPTLNEDALYGLAGKVVRTIEPHTEADLVAILINLLSTYGNMIGRGSWKPIGASRHHMKINAVLMGETSKARKGMSWDAVKDLFKVLDEQYMEDRAASGLSSGEGLIGAVRDTVYGEDKNGDQIVVDPGVKDKRLLVMEGEFANVLKQAQREGNILSIVIRNLWDDATVQTLTKNPVKASETHVSIIGHITLIELQKLLSQSDASNGFANRFVWMCVRRSKSLPYGGDWSKVNVQPLVSELKRVVEFGKDAGEIVWGHSPDELWRESYDRLAEGQPGLFGAMTSRSEAQVVRLACIYALMDMSKTIEIDHLRAALALWQYAEDSVRYVFGNATGDKVADRIEDALISASKVGMTRNELRDLFDRHQPSEKIGKALDLLQRAGRVRTEKEATGGRPVERWFYCG